MYPLVNQSSSFNNYFLPGMPMNNNLSAGTCLPTSGNPLQMLQQDALIISSLMTGLESLESQIMSYLGGQMPQAQTGYTPPVGLMGTSQYTQSMPANSMYGTYPYAQSMPTDGTTGMSQYTQSMPCGCPPLVSDPNNPGSDPGNPDMSGLGAGVATPGSAPQNPPSGANPNPQDGAAALVQALNNQDTQTVNQLIQQGVDVTATDPQSGEPLLSIAAASGNADDVKALINAVPQDQQKDYVNKTDANGQTALFQAGAKNNQDIVQALINAGADTNIKDSNGDTASSWTQKNSPNADSELMAIIAPTITYQGVKISDSSMTSDELNAIKKALDIFSQDPDGKILTSKMAENGIVIRKDDAEAGKIGAAAFSNAGNKALVIAQGYFNDHKDITPQDASGLEVLGHEMTHNALAVAGAGADSNDQEALASVVGRRIRYRYDHLTHDVTLAGQTFSYDGSDAAQQKDYEYGLKLTPNDPRDPKVFDYMKKLGINLNFGPAPSS